MRALLLIAVSPAALLLVSQPTIAQQAGTPEAQGVTSSGVEQVTVRAGVPGVNGVTNTTPGGGLMVPQTASKSVSEVSRDFIAKQAPTENALTLLQDLPGIIVASADPLGLTDHMGLSIRGLNQTEVGSVYEGMPAADPIGYLPYTAEWDDSENVRSVTITQGSANIADPVYNAAGGTLRVQLRDPSYHPGAFIDLSFGSKSLQREFGRIDTGTIGNSGIRAFVSFSSATNNEWRGVGNERREHVDAKLLKTWGEANSIAPRISWTSLRGATDTYPTLAQFQQYGRSYNYNGNYYFGDTRYQPFYTYYRNSIRISAPSHFDLTEHLSLDTTPYFEWVHSTPNGGTTLNSTKSFFGNQPAGALALPYSINGIATAESQSLYTEYSQGINSYMTWHRGNNTARLGYWYSYFDYNQATSFAIANFQGQVASDFGKYPIHTASGAVLRTYAAHVLQQLNSIYADDTLKLLNDTLTLNAGFKTVMIYRTGTNLVPGPTYRTGASNFEPLPQLSVSYFITPRDQIYSDVATAFSEPGAAYFDIFSVANGGYSLEHNPNLRPEFSISEELGYRHNGLVNVSLAFFNYNLTNKQVSSTQIVGGTPTALYINAGGQTTRGVDAEVGLRPWHYFSPYISGQFLHSTINNNIQSGADYLPTKGKTSVLSPKFSGAIGLNYDNGSIFGNFALNYVDSQYSTFVDDQSIPAYLTANAAIGYRFQNVGFLKKPQIQVNFINIGDENYISGAFGVAGNARTTRGVFGTTLAGSSPTYWIGAGFASYVSMSSAF